MMISVDRLKGHLLANPDSIVTITDEYGYAIGYVMSPTLLEKIEEMPGVVIGPPQIMEV